MSTLIFLAAIGGFVLVAHWAYINDSVRPSDGSKGWLRMKGVGVELPVAKKSQARWRKDEVGGERMAPRGRGRVRRLDQADPRWKRRPR